MDILFYGGRATGKTTRALDFISKQNYKKVLVVADINVNIFAKSHYMCFDNTIIYKNDIYKLKQDYKEFTEFISRYDAVFMDGINFSEYIMREFITLISHFNNIKDTIYTTVGDR